MLQPFLFSDPCPYPPPPYPWRIETTNKAQGQENPFRQIGGFSGQVIGKTADLLSKDDTSCRYAKNVSVNTIEFPVLYCTLRPAYKYNKFGY